MIGLALAVLLQVSLASAGALQVRDTASLLSSSDRSQIEAVVARYPFDVRVLTTSAYTDQPSFSRYIGSQVSEPNQIVIGLDPVHRHTQVHFGTGTRISRSEWDTIEKAGNTAFRDGRWAAGVTSILDQAGIAVGTGSATQAPASSTSSSSGWGIGGIILVLVIIAVPILIIMGIVAAIRGAARRTMGYGGPGYGGGGGGYGGPGYSPGYGPGYGPQGGGGMGPLGGGLIGAGLGGVAGYELGKMEGERERNDPYGGGGGGGYDSGSSNDGGGGSYDAGGGGSSWDSGGGGSGGGDSGGGGGDSGGGGGGSDW